MSKEFILGSSYRCLTTADPHYFTVGSVYRTYERVDSFGVRICLVCNKNNRHNLSLFEFRTTTFEEVKDEDNTIQVGDVVRVRLSMEKYWHVLGVDDKKIWTSDGINHVVRDLHAVIKAKDIRTIECAGGAVRMTGEYVRTFVDGRIRVKLPELFIGAIAYNGIEVSQTPSQPH